MGRISTWVLVGAVVALGLAATVDALQEGDDGARPAAGEEPRAPAREPWGRTVARELRDDGVRGTLVLTDRRCRVHSFRLPDLEAVETAFQGSCSTREVAAPGGQAVARCSRGTGKVVSARGGEVIARFPGCAPAWKPDGELTFVHRGELALREPCGDGSGCTLLSRADLDRALAGPPWRIRRAALSEVAWMREDVFAAIVRDEARGQDLIAVFRGRELVGAPLFTYDDLANLRVSPYGTYAAATNRSRRGGGRGDGIAVVNREGELLGAGLRGGRVIAWSPDETWTAMGREDGVYVFETALRPVRLVRLPVRATDLSWR